MLDTRQPILRNVWRATVPTNALEDGPKPFKLLGREIALVLDGEGRPAGARGQAEAAR
jgi:hypothetical protein